MGTLGEVVSGLVRTRILHDRRMVLKKRSKGKGISLKRLFVAAGVFAILLAGALFLLYRYMPGNTWADLNEIYGAGDGQIAVFYNDERLEETAILENGEIYFPYSMVVSSINSRFYQDTEEEKILYTLPEGNAQADFSASSYEYNGQENAMEYPVSVTREGQLYLSLELISHFTDLRWETYENPGRVFLDARWGTVTNGTMEKRTQVRYRGGIKSEILCEVQKGDSVTILEELDTWAKVRTESGHIGYILKRTIGSVVDETLESQFEQPVYSSVSAKKEGDIFLVWHDLYTKSANSSLEEMMEEEEGVTVISPTWFSLSGHEGGYTSIADSAYVDKAHEMGLEVWIRVDNFDTETYTYEALRKTENRQKLVKGLVEETQALNGDGINVDFEAVTAEAGEHYVQFIRELSVECHKAGLVLSVDNYIPTQGRAHYNLAEQAVFADYVIIMGYDEHWVGSEAGSNASLPFTERAIESSLALVPKEKLIHAIPFFTRIWKETEGTADTPDVRNDGNSEYEYYTLEVTACGMGRPWELFAQYGVTPQWQEDLGQYYGEYYADGGKYRIWVEDVRSIEEKMKLISQADLAGCAAWKLGLETSDVWEVIASYLDQ